jgi:hypothetical protein
MGFKTIRQQAASCVGPRFAPEQRAHLRVGVWGILATLVAAVVGPILVWNLSLLVGGPQTINEAQLRTKLADGSVIPNFIVPGRVDYVTLPGLPATAADFSVTDGEDDHIYDFRYVFVGKEVFVTKVEGYGPTLATGELRRLTGETETYARKGLLRLGKEAKLVPYVLDTTTNVHEKLGTLVGLLGFVLMFSIIGFGRSLLWLRSPPKPLTNYARSGMFVGPRQVLRELFCGPSSLRSFATASATVASAVLVSAALAIAPASPTGASTWPAQVKPLAEFVESLRGGPFEHPVPIDLLSHEQYDLVARNQAAGITTPCQNSEFSKETQSLVGAFCKDVGSTGDLRRSTYALLGVTQSAIAQEPSAHLASIGFYSPIDKRLYVRGNKLTAEVTAVLVHELTHAWQDQRFHLGLFQPSSSEELVAWKALVEGDATYVEQAYRQTQRGARIAQKSGTKSPAQDARALRLRESTNAVLASNLNPLLPYLAGPTYIKQLRLEGLLTTTGRVRGTEALDLAFGRPPSNIAQIVGATGLEPKPDRETEKLLPLLQAHSPFPNEEATVAYEEQLDASSFFALTGRTGSYRQRLQSWHGGVLQLATNGDQLCAQVTIRTREAVAPIVVPQEDYSIGDFGSLGRIDRPPVTYQLPEDTIVARRACWTGPRSIVFADPHEQLLGRHLRSALQSWSISSALANQNQTTASADRCLAEVLADRLEHSGLTKSTVEEFAIMAQSCGVPESAMANIMKLV